MSHLLAGLAAAYIVFRVGTLPWLLAETAPGWVRALWSVCAVNTWKVFTAAVVGHEVNVFSPWGRIWRRESRWGAAHDPRWSSVFEAIILAAMFNRDNYTPAESEAMWNLYARTLPRGARYEVKRL